MVQPIRPRISCVRARYTIANYGIEGDTRALLATCSRPVPNAGNPFDDAPGVLGCPGTSCRGRKLKRGGKMKLIQGWINLKIWDLNIGTNFNGPLNISLNLEHRIRRQKSDLLTCKCNWLLRLSIVRCLHC